MICQFFVTLSRYPVAVQWLSNGCPVPTYHIKCHIIIKIVSAAVCVRVFGAIELAIETTEH